MPQEVKSVAKVVEADSADLYENFLKPMVKVGREFVTEVSNFLGNDIHKLRRRRVTFI